MVVRWILKRKRNKWSTTITKHDWGIKPNQIKKSNNNDGHVRSSSKRKQIEKEEMKKTKSMRWLPSELKPVHVLVVFFSPLFSSVVNVWVWVRVCVHYNVVVYDCLTMNIFFHYIASYHFEFMYICCILYCAYKQA